MVRVKDVSDGAMMHFPKLGRKRILIEDAKVSVQRTESAKNAGNFKPPCPFHKKGIRPTRLKRMSMYYGIKTEW